MLNQYIRTLIVLFVLTGFILSSIIFVSIFYVSTRFNGDDVQDTIISHHYDIEFIDHSHYLNCRTDIFFQIVQSRYQIFVTKSLDHTIEMSSIALYKENNAIPIKIQIKSNEIIIRPQRQRSQFYSGNYSISIQSRVNPSITTNASFMQQTWSSNRRILFTNNHLFPYISDSIRRPTYTLKIISSDDIISNSPLNQTDSLFETSQITFALLHQYECRMIDLLQLCLPTNTMYEFDLFSYILTYMSSTVQVFESYFAQKFPLKKLTVITVLELNNQFISKSGIVFIDQNSLLTNTSAEQIIQQKSLIYTILAYQWTNLLMQFDEDTQWFGQGLARSIAHYLFHKNNNFLVNNNLQVDDFMSTIIIDSLCTEKLFEDTTSIKLKNNLIRKSEAFLTEYRMYVGDDQFHLQVQQLIQYSNKAAVNQSILSSIFSMNESSVLTWSNISGHPMIIFNASTIHMQLFKFNSNCSSSITPISSIIYHLLNDSLVTRSDIVFNSSSTLVPLNPFIHISYSSWNQLIDEVKHVVRYHQFNSLSRLLFDSFLLNMANQISVRYPLQLINFIFQQPITILTKNDLFIIKKIVEWYRSMLPNVAKEKFISFLRKTLHPLCVNHQWNKQTFTDMKTINQQLVNDLLLELCCSVNHSICFIQIPNRNDPHNLLQSIFNNQRNDLVSVVHQNQTDMLTSYNQLQIPSLFVYPDRIIVNIICQTVRQQNDKYWHDLIYYIQEKFYSHTIPSAIINGLSCAIQTIEQLDFYLNHLCPPSPFQWPCFKNILEYSTIKDFKQLNNIANEQWPLNIDEIVDFLFYASSSVESTLCSEALILEFQTLTYTWLTNNQYEFLDWLDNEYNQNAY